MSTNDPVEHQATVEKGLRMKIKRKTPVASSAATGSAAASSPPAKVPPTGAAGSSTSVPAADTTKSATKADETGVSPKLRRGGTNAAEDREDRSPGSSSASSSATASGVSDHVTASTDSPASGTTAAAANGEEKGKKKGSGTTSRGGSGNAAKSAAVPTRSDKDRGETSERKESARKDGGNSSSSDRKAIGKDVTPVATADGRKSESGKTGANTSSTNRKRSAGQANFSSSDGQPKASKTDSASAAGSAAAAGSSSGSVSLKVEDIETEKPSAAAASSTSATGCSISESKSEVQGTAPGPNTGDGGGTNAAGPGFDPYEFVAKFEEDAIVSPMKKFKSEKIEPPTSISGSSSISTTAANTAASGSDSSGPTGLVAAAVTAVTSSAGACPSVSGAAAATGSPTSGTVVRTSDASTSTCNVGVMTDPDCLGPCEPGTSIVLEGIVWSESNNGILVVNVTWRGKTYVGTLMDATKHHWASPRFQEETSLVELDWRSPKAKRSALGTDAAEGRRLRKCRRNANGASSKTTGPSPVPTAASANGSSSSGDASGSGSAAGRSARKSRSAADSATNDGATGKLVSGSSGGSSSSSLVDQNGSAGGLCDTEDGMLECNGPNCNKKYKHINGLRYHQSHAHKNHRLDSMSCSSDELLNAAMSASHVETSDKGAAVDASRKTGNTGNSGSSSRKNGESAAVATDSRAAELPPTAMADESSIKQRTSPDVVRAGDVVDGEKSSVKDGNSGSLMATSADARKDGELSASSRSGSAAVGAFPVHSVDDLSKRTLFKQYETNEATRSKSADGGIHVQSAGAASEREATSSKGCTTGQHGSERRLVDEFGSSETKPGETSLSRVHHQSQQQHQQSKTGSNQLPVSGPGLPSSSGGHHSSKASLGGSGSDRMSSSSSSKFPTDDRSRLQSSVASASASKDVPNGSQKAAVGARPGFPSGPAGGVGPVSSPSAETAYRKHLEMMQQQAMFGGVGPIPGPALPPGMMPPTPPGLGPGGPLGPLGPGGSVEEYARIAAAAMYGYGLDPAAAAAYQAHFLAATNPEYRINLERFVAEQRFQQQQQLMAAVASGQPPEVVGQVVGGGLRPVDMSSKVPTPSGFLGRSSSPPIQSSSRSGASHQSGGSTTGGGHRHDRDRPSGSGPTTPVPPRRPSPARDRSLTGGSSLGRDIQIKTEKMPDIDRKDIKRERDDQSSKSSILSSSSKWAETVGGLVPSPLQTNVDRSKLKSGILPPALSVDVAAASHTVGPFSAAATSGLLSSLSPTSAAKLVGRPQPPFDLPLGRDGPFPGSLFPLPGSGVLGLNPAASAPTSGGLYDPSVAPPAGLTASNYADMVDGHHSKSFKDSVTRRTDKQSRQPSPLAVPRSDKHSSSGSWPGGSGKDKQDDGSRFTSGSSGKPSTPQSSEKLPTPGLENPGSSPWIGDKAAAAAGAGGGVLGPVLPGGIPGQPTGPPHAGSPMTLRHLHTHHHTHVVQSPAGYPIYGLIPPVPALVPPVPPALSVPQPFIPK